jgi:hypothetical protein
MDVGNNYLILNWSFKDKISFIGLSSGLKNMHKYNRRLFKGKYYGQFSRLQEGK